MKTEFLQDIFYNIESLSQDDRFRLISQAMEMSEDIEIDKIVGWQRQIQPDADPQEWLTNKPKPDSMWRFIHRRGYADPFHGQVVIREGGDFIWVNLTEAQLNHFIVL